MKNEIKYVGFYSFDNLKYKRNSALSAMDKMNYVSGVINKIGYNVCLVVPSWIIGKGSQLQKHIKISNSQSIVLPPSVGSSTKFTTYTSIIMSQLWLFFYLVLNVKRNEKIIVYHSPWLALSILIAKKIKGFKLILEVEEIYKDVLTIHPLLDKLETKIITQSDAYIFSTELLEKKLNNHNKPYTILYGNYEVPKTITKPIDDGKIHLVYAGIIDSHKAGAFNAIEAATYLKENYVMHIIGFGEVEKLQNRIVQINQISNCKVQYDGIKRGDEYIAFCQSCHVGLSTQNMQGDYVDSSFPSKILSYMSLGLNVVSCEVKCVLESKITLFINYYNGDSKDLANSIMNIKLNNSDSCKEMMVELDTNFQTEIKVLLC
jgi:hypothetical protein